MQVERVRGARCGSFVSRPGCVVFRAHSGRSQTPADAPSTRRSLQVCWRVFGECKCSRVSLEISPNHLGEERPGENGRRIPELNLREGGGLGPVAQALFASWRTRMATRTVISDWWFCWHVWACSCGSANLCSSWRVRCYVFWSILAQHACARVKVHLTGKIPLIWGLRLTEAGLWRRHFPREVFKGLLKQWLLVCFVQCQGLRERSARAITLCWCPSIIFVVDSTLRMEGAARCVLGVVTKSLSFAVNSLQEPWKDRPHGWTRRN